MVSVLGTLCYVLEQEAFLSVPLSTQVYKWVHAVPANLMLGVWHPIQGVEIHGPPSCFMLRKSEMPA